MSNALTPNSNRLESLPLEALTDLATHRLKSSVDLLTKAREAQAASDEVLSALAASNRELASALKLVVESLQGPLSYEQQVARMVLILDSHAGPSIQEIFQFVQSRGDGRSFSRKAYVLRGQDRNFGASRDQRERDGLMGKLSALKVIEKLGKGRWQLTDIAIEAYRRFEDQMTD